MDSKKMPKAPQGFYYPQNKAENNKKDAKWIWIAVLLDIIGLLLLFSFLVSALFITKTIGQGILRGAETIVQSEEFSKFKEEMQEYEKDPEAYQEEMSRKIEALEKEYLDDAEKAIQAEKDRLAEAEKAEEEAQTTFPAETTTLPSNNVSFFS